MKQGSPIAISGLGGSGTRVIADILIRAGVFLGDRLNTPLDNLWFTLLFVHEGYFKKKEEERDRIIRQRLDIFSRKMTGLTVYAPGDIQLLQEVAGDYSNTSDFFGSVQNFVSEFTAKLDRSNNQSGIWGWKEPNTHIYLDYLIDYFPGLRYIHVIRHGLDMACSKNQNQLRRWGGVFGIQNSGCADISPQVAFEFWQLMNRRAITLASRLPQDRFLLVNYDDLCNSPEAGVTRILDFLGLPLARELKRSLFKLPSPVSKGRYRNHDFSWLGEKQKKELENLGFVL